MSEPASSRIQAACGGCAFWFTGLQPPRSLTIQKPMASQNLPAAQQSELVIVANTLPVRREELDGELRWAQSPGGLVSALSPIVREAGGCWVGWTGGADDAPAPFRREGILNVAVPVSEAEVAGSYEGMCNSTLVAAVPRRGAAAGVPPALVEPLRGRQPALCRGGQRAGRRPAAGFGFTTTTCNSYRGCCASCGLT